MRTRNRVALLCVAIAAVAGDAVAQQPTEQEIVEAIVRDGPRAQAIRAASDVVTSAQAARRPFPNPSASYAREGAGFTEFFMVEQPLPAFGVRGALERAGVAARDAAAAERDAALWQLRSDARGAIARLRASTERREASRSIVRSIERLIEVLGAREREGEGSRFDRLRAEQELVDAQQVVVAATIEQAEAAGVLAGMLPPGVAVPQQLAVTERAPLGDVVDGLVSRALASRAELRALTAAVRHFELEADAARSATGLAPVVSGGLKRAGDGNATHSGGVFGVSVAVPLFNRGAREAERWTAERRRAEFERSMLETNVRAQVTRAFDALRLRGEAAPRLAAAASAGNELIEIATVAYREGDIGILQLIDAYRTAARASERAIDGNLTLTLSQIALEGAVGVPLWP